MRRTLAVAAVVLAHCGATIEGDGGRHPPPRPGTPCVGGIDVETFAIDSIDLGESDWQTLGWDLDGKITTKDSTDVCIQEVGAPRVNQADGDEGIDDAFGYVLTPVLATSLQDPQISTTITSAIQSGRFTLQIQIVGLDDTPVQTCDGLKGQAFVSDSYGGVPAFDATTDWPVMSASLNDGATVASGSKYAFTDAYVQNGTFVAGASEAVTIALHVVLADRPLDLLVHHALLTFDHPNAQEATHGVLAGVLDPTELKTAVKYGLPPCCLRVCGNGDPIGQASDILSDRTNAPGVACDAISFAIGFHARRVANPTKVAPPLPTPPPPCP